MNSFEAFFAQELGRRLAAERQSRLEALAARVDTQEYLVRVGYLQALDWVLDECRDVERMLKSPMRNEG